MKKFLATILSLTLLLGVVGCGKSDDSGKKKFVFSSSVDIQSLDSSATDDGMSMAAIHAMTDGLMGLDKDGKVAPALAESFTVSDDRTVYTYKLRDTKWSNGDPVTADDFVYAWQKAIRDSGSYEYMFGSDGAAIKNADKLREIKSGGKNLTPEELNTLGIKAIDPKTVEITLEYPCAYFDSLMTFPCYYPINRKFAEEKGTAYAQTADAVLSNGAFILKKWELGSKAVFEKNPDYWNSKDVKLDEMTMMLVQDPKTAATNFESGYTDYAMINSSLVDKYKGTPEYKERRSGYASFIYVNHANPILQNENIVKGLSYAIDRKDFAENILKDGSKEADGFVPRELSSHDGKDFRDIAEDYTSFDLAKAQEYFDKGLKELGKDSVKISLVYGTDESPMDQMATYLQNSFSKIKGLQIEMIATTKKDRLQNWHKNKKFELSLTSWGPDYADPMTYLTYFSPTNKASYSNPEYMDLLDKIKVESDENKRYDMMIKEEKILLDTAGVIPVIERGAAVLQRETVKNFIVRPVGVQYTFNYVDIEK